MKKLLAIILLAATGGGYYLYDQHPEAIDDFLGLNQSTLPQPIDGTTRDTFYAGQPGILAYPNRIRLLPSPGFTVGYDEIRGVPAWAGYRIIPKPNRIACLASV